MIERIKCQLATHISLLIGIALLSITFYYMGAETFIRYILLILTSLTFWEWVKKVRREKPINFGARACR